MKKRNRIKKKEEFQELIHQGKKKVNPSFVFYYQKKMEEQSMFMYMNNKNRENGNTTKGNVNNQLYPKQATN